MRPDELMQLFGIAQPSGGGGGWNPPALNINSLVDVFRHSGKIERDGLMEDEQQKKERLRQLKIKQMLQMLENNPGAFQSKEEIDKILSRESYFM